MNPDGERLWQLVDFGGLPAFSRVQAQSCNALLHVLGATADWQKWITGGLSEFFESPAGLEICLRQKNTINAQEGIAMFASTAQEIHLGRDGKCDVRLAPRSVGNRHARIFTEDGICFIEDLGSALGTFLNDVRLTAYHPAQLNTGDQFSIFPYAFTVEIRQKWVRTSQINIVGGQVKSLNGRELHELPPIDRRRLAVELLPAGATFALEAPLVFLESLAAVLIAPLCPEERSRLGIASMGMGFFELLTAAVLERVNHDLAFPLQLQLASQYAPSSGQHQGGALAFPFSIRIGKLSGAFRILITDQEVELLGHSVIRRELCPVVLPELSWTFLLSAGHIELSSQELASIEAGDVVMLTRETALVFPDGCERGWKMRQLPGNVYQTLIDNYFERGCLSDNGTKLQTVTGSGTAPDLMELPVRLHAIMGEKQMTLAEASKLVPGTIVDLDQTKAAPVRISLNGKLSGFGELVELDGRLGIRIVEWRTT